VDFLKEIENKNVCTAFDMLFKVRAILDEDSVYTSYLKHFQGNIIYLELFYLLMAHHIMSLKKLILGLLAEKNTKQNWYKVKLSTMDSDQRRNYIYKLKVLSDEFDYILGISFRWTSKLRVLTRNIDSKIISQKTIETINYLIENLSDPSPDKIILGKLNDRYEQLVNILKNNPHLYKENIIVVSNNPFTGMKKDVEPSDKEPLIKPRSNSLSTIGQVARLAHLSNNFNRICRTGTDEQRNRKLLNFKNGNFSLSKNMHEGGAGFTKPNKIQPIRWFGLKDKLTMAEYEYMIEVENFAHSMNYLLCPKSVYLSHFRFSTRR
jgi:hypothetical protein